MNVKLISCTPEPEKIVAAAAKNCYSGASVDAIMDGLTEDAIASFMDRLAEIGHESPLEHASFTFAIEGVSRSLLAQITRHRIASFSVQSQRYVRQKGFEYVVPPEIEAVPAAKTLFQLAMKADQKVYEELTETLMGKYIPELIASGVSEKEAYRRAEKKAIEDARYVFPNACTTKIVMTMNARELRHFFRLRCCNRAQWEIQELADKMLALCTEAAPHLFQNAGAPCDHGVCTEGKMSCGQPRRRTADEV